MEKRHENEPETIINRREFLRLMSASLALAGVAGCNTAQPPVETIVPYVREPQEITPGEPLFYATAMTLGGYALGLLVESREGRPTKVEGNPLHPASLGATDIFAQASVLSLYDPDRSQNVLHLENISTWDAFFTDLQRNLANQKTKQGAGLRFLTETFTSPTLAAQIQQLSQIFPQAVWHSYEPITRDNEREGAMLAFGEDVETFYKLDQAEIVLSLDADIFSESAGRVRYARDFSQKRRVRDGQTAMNRLYVVEPSPTITGAIADHRLALKSSEIEIFIRQLAGNFGVGQTIGNADYNVWLNALTKDLNQHRGASIIVAGKGQPPVVHALAQTLNNALGNVGKTVFYTPPVVNSGNQTESLRSLVANMDAEKVEMLVIIGGNPVYNAPVDFHFAESLRKVNWRAHLSLYADETSAACHWHVPAAHELEMWSDARAFDGTASIIQPLIAPLFGGKSAHELLAAFTDQPELSAYEIVRGFWQSQSTQNFEQSWQQALRDGVIVNTAFQPKTVNLKTDWLNSAKPQIQNSQSLELIFKPDPTVYDGRFANNSWLQELPKPLTKLTWDNAALMSPATAQRLGFDDRVADVGGSHGQTIAEIAELSFQGNSVFAPVFILPGHADNCVTVTLGYGRTHAGQIGNGAGFNAYNFRFSNAMWFAKDLQIKKTGEQFSLACTQRHHSMEGRDLTRYAALEEYRQNPTFAKREADDPEKQISLYPEWEYPGHAWGMAIDTSVCTGCSACVVACQAENNIPVVGKEEVLRAREMHWLRIDRYYEDLNGESITLHQPLPCQHCEKAPCEVVCPVEATTHSSEGLNEMTYNRCVGTRYCSNNCPYKVRRFNFFGYSDFDTPLVQLQRNPEVTVRSRGVMEKCTYCVQRIQHAKIQAEVENREVRDGEIVAACQQACPTEAIIFGDINDPNSRVSQLKREPTNYGLLAELNTRPRTTYLATIKNLNNDLKKE